MIEFQIYDYLEDHDKNEDETETEDSKDKNYVPDLPKYIIHVFGRIEDDRSVYCKVVDFQPYFFIKFPSKWDEKSAKAKVKILKRWCQSSENKKVWKKFRNGLVDVKVRQARDAIGFSNDNTFRFAKLIFDNTYAMKKFRYMFEQNKVEIAGVTNGEYQFKTYEANLPPMLRWSHIKKISGCSWVKVDKYTKIDDEADKRSYCDIELTVNWNDLEPITKDFNAPFRIASFDIECNSVDGQFPQARRKGDACIQIGTTYTHVGESMPYRQHIVCLLDTNPVENCVTESYDNEADMVKAWKKEIIKSDCDIITGYNIFFFDEKYLYDRCDLHLNLKYEMSLISKLKDYECNFRDFKLASSALGENMLRYWDTPGRIHVDLMKDVQKTYNLSSYKLDSVSSNFIRGKITNPELVKKKKKKGEDVEYSYLLHCDDINDIQVEDFIHIEHMKSFVSEYVGNKYFVKEIDKQKKTLLVDSPIEINNVDEGSLFWSQAKDDVGPQDIFRLQKEGPAERSIVAKYCVKDCRLVNLLVNKLEVVTKNIEMANVCYVPLSYLFVRGQGIKLFSLCLKIYKEEGYIFPVVEKGDQADSGYEGAIVFDPVPNVYYQPLVTKDYASLYPSSIIQKNMSHETIVKSSSFDSLPGVKYYNAQFKQNDGTIKYVRFAQKDGELGVVPKILTNLLKERKAVKKLMKVEKDVFKYKILDAKQLALKVTANSLYGQLGAPTSQVYMKSIAACTTSTGREMLIFAKKYDEEILPGFLNGLKYAFIKNDEEMIKKLLELELKDPNDEKLVEKIKNYVLELNNKNFIFQPIIRYGDTDSIFSCYCFRENAKLLKKEKSLVKWKAIVQFSRILMEFFIPDEHKETWNSLHKEYYSEEKINNKLMLPSPPDAPPYPDHHNIILPIEDRMKQFLKEYMEESYMPWLWTLQELYFEYEDKLDPKVFAEIINVKLYKMGEHQLEKMRLTFDIGIDENDCNETIDGIATNSDDNSVSNKEIDINSSLVEKLANIQDGRDALEQNIKEFLQGYMTDIYIEPYWSIGKSKKVKVKFWKGGDRILDKRGLDLSIEMGIITGETVKKRLPFPHDLEYEKTFWPFAILTKKRYVGNKYEFDSENFKKDFMGIVLKRRDNAPIVKEICNGIIDALLNHKDPEKAKEYTKDCIAKMFDDKYDINYFLTSKTLKLKESYKDWTKIGHVVLAERIGIRDPGNKPQSGDRIQYAVIKIPNKTKETLQGEMIETPKFINEQKLKLDYVFYMTNQIMNPALQFLDLAMKNAQDIIFNKYIFVEKIQELVKEKIEIAESMSKELDEEYSKHIPFNPVDHESRTTEDLDESIDELKKQVRKLKAEKRKYDKELIKKLENEKNGITEVEVKKPKAKPRGKKAKAEVEVDV